MTWEAVVQWFCQAGLVEKTEGNRSDSTSTWRCPFLEMPQYSHDAFTRGLTPMACWTSVHFYGMFFKVASLLLPESPTGSPRRGALLGRCSDRFQMLLECGRGQQRSVEASLQLWLIGVRLKLGVTFLDSDPLSLSLSFPFLCSHPTPSILSAAMSSDACVLYPVETVWSSAGSRHFKSGSVPHLCWTFNELFYSLRLNPNRNL